jgi:hypothetical protein
MLRNTLTYKYSLIVQLTDVRSDRANHKLCRASVIEVPMIILPEKNGS